MSADLDNPAESLGSKAKTAGWPVNIGIDPGTKASGWISHEDGSTVYAWGHEPNEVLLKRLEGTVAAGAAGLLAIEIVSNQGNVVGTDVLQTAVWTGAFQHAWGKWGEPEGKVDLIRRSSAVSALMGSAYQMVEQTDGSRTRKGYTKSEVRDRLIEKMGGWDELVGGLRCKKCKGKGWFGAGRPVCPVCDGAAWIIPKGPLFHLPMGKMHVWDALAVLWLAEEIPF